MRRRVSLKQRGAAVLMAVVSALAADAAVADMRRTLEAEARRNGAPMAWIKDGTFMMGAHEGPSGTPSHVIYLYAFYMDVYEVTASRYAQFMKSLSPANPAFVPMFWEEVRLPEDGDKPVLGVTWQAAAAFCEWAGKRLPTEAEWEKAARGTDGRSYPWGEALPSRAWANYHASLADQRFSDSLRPVDSDEAGRSPYGIYGMAGNVSEWVADWYDADYYANSPKSNPPGPSQGTHKVIRGGSFGDLAAEMKSSARESSVPSVLGAFVGIRCAQDSF